MKRRGLPLMFLLVACSGRIEPLQGSGGPPTVLKVDTTDRTGRPDADSGTDSTEVPPFVTEDTVRFDTPPPPCPGDSECDGGSCVVFATVEGWKDKPVCVTGFPCNHLTCGMGKGCWHNSPDVVCGTFTAPNQNLDAGPKPFP